MQFHKYIKNVSIHNVTRLVNLTYYLKKMYNFTKFKYSNILNNSINKIE